MGEWRKSRGAGFPRPCKLCHFCVPVYIPHLIWTSHPPHPPQDTALPHFIEEETETREGSALLTYSISGRSWVQHSVQPVSQSPFPGPGWAQEEERPAGSRWRYSTGICRRLEVQSDWRPTRYESILSNYSAGICRTGIGGGCAFVKKLPHHVNDIFYICI